MRYEIDGGNIITSIQISQDLIKTCEDTYGDKNVLFHWIKDNLDKNASLTERPLDSFGIGFAYEDIKTGIFVSGNSDGKMNRFTLLTPDIELGEKYYGEIRRALDSSTIISNNKSK